MRDVRNFHFKIEHKVSKTVLYIILRLPFYVLNFRKERYFYENLYSTRVDSVQYLILKMCYCIRA